MAKKQQVEVIEDDDDVEEETIEETEDLEELEDEDEEEVPQPPKKKKAATPTPPVKKSSKPKAKTEEPEVWGVRQLIDLIKAKYDKDYNPREVRTLLRKLAREGKLDREIIAGNKLKWAWTGPEDPEVSIVLKAVKGGSIEVAKKAALDKMKADKAARDAAAAKATAKAKKGKTPVEDDDDDDD